jgi:hypothetical protein
MADAATFVLRSENGGGLPWSPGTLESVLKKAENDRILDALTDSIEASAILSLMKGKDNLTLTVSALLHQIILNTSEESRRLLPKTTKEMGTQISRLAPFLRHVGIEVERRREGHAGTRLVSFKRV